MNRVQTAAVWLTFICPFAPFPPGARSETTARAEERIPLSSDEIAAGWIMLFDGQTDFGWQHHGAEVKNGSLHVAGKAAAATTTAFGQFELAFETEIDDESCSPVLVLSNPHDEAKTVRIAIRPYKPAEKGKKKFHLRVENGKRTFKVSAPDGSMTEYPAEPWTGPGVVHVGFACLEDKGGFSVRDLKLRPLGTHSIFNGKDLTGWKAVPGHPAKFDVTPEGWLNVREGRGDLHTEKSYDDFVLQLDIISNGKHLNSGIFFRSLPGEFWSGYESQIRNEWKGDRTKPHDYGTGGIYNRQPARKVVSSDHEWFTKTLVVHGNHMAVWINGYQVSDFTDSKPMAKSARQGRKDDAGTISIQGHDPTTNLSFRNIRIAELPKS